jgi:phosphatidylethanolamine-binding protein (PEBP) family uncharacterized protein
MPEHTRLRFTKTKAGMLTSLLAAGAIAASGCGESTSSAPSAQAGSTSPAPSSTTTSSDTQATSTAHTGASSTGGGKHSAPSAPAAGGRHRSRVHLVLPPPGSHQAPKLTANERAAVSVADITLSSPAIKQIRNASTPTLARQYTCQGADHSPPLRWTSIPPGTKELALFAISTRPVAGKLYFDWAIAGLSPSLKGLTSASVPAGAVLGRASSGHPAYSICPAAGKQESYVFALYALPQSLAPRAGFDPATLRQQAIQVARHTGLLVGTYG